METKFEELENSWFNGQHKQFRKQLKKLSCESRYDFYVRVSEKADRNIYENMQADIALACITRTF